MKTVFVRGRIVTMDRECPAAEALAIVDGHIAAVGTEAEVRALAGGGATVVDLDGATMLPGFIDAHHHFSFAALDRLGVDCRACRSIDDIRETLRAAAAHMPAGAWLRAWGYDEQQLTDGRHPRREELDAAAPGHPVLLLHVTYHAGVASSLALVQAGIDRATADPPAGRIGRDRRGEPNGLLYDQALDAVETACRAGLDVAPESLIEAALTEAARLHGFGITRLCDAAVPPGLEFLYRALAADPRFRLRVEGLAVSARGIFSPPDDRLHARPVEGSGYEPSGVKFFADGATQCAICLSKWAALRVGLRMIARTRRLVPSVTADAPLRLERDGRVHSGIVFHRREALAQMIVRASALGLGSAVHAEGNEGIEVALAAMEDARQMPGCDRARLRIEHVMLAESRQLARFRPAQLSAVVQPRFVHDFGDLILDAGADAVLEVLPFAQLAGEGAQLAGSSDSPATDPAVLPAIESAVTRRTARGRELGRAEALTIDQALALYTTGAAAVLGLEGRAGVLRRGADGDLVVLSADPRTSAPEQIGAITVRETWIAGQRVHPPVPPRRPRAA